MREHFRLNVSRFARRLGVVAGTLAMIVALGCQKPASTPPDDATPAADATSKVAAEKTAKPAAITARQVLTRMVDAYRNASSYSDDAKLRLVAEAGNARVFDQSVDLAVALVRPNKLRVTAYQVTLACDGHKLLAAIASIPNEVLEKPAPAKIDLRVFRREPQLAMNIADLVGLPPQLLFLLADDPLAALLRNAAEPELGEPGQIEGRDCYRVKIRTPDSAATLWIDQESLVLRRVVYPSELLQQLLGDSAADKYSVVAELSGARLNAPVDPKAFAFEIPPKAEIVKFFVPPHIAQLLGKPLPDFTFTALDGKPITRASLAGKATVLDFWATWCGYCKQSLPELQKVYQSRKNDPGVAFYAVSADGPQVRNKQLTKEFADLKVDIPILRGDSTEIASVLKIGGFPTTLLVDAKGIVQYYFLGADEKEADVLPEVLDKIIAGKDVYQPLLAQYQEQLEHLRQYAEKLDKMADEPAVPATENAGGEWVPDTKPAQKATRQP